MGSAAVGIRFDRIPESKKKQSGKETRFPRIANKTGPGPLKPPIAREKEKRERETGSDKEAIFRRGVARDRRRLAGRRAPRDLAVYASHTRAHAR